MKRSPDSCFEVSTRFFCHKSWQAKEVSPNLGDLWQFWELDLVLNCKATKKNVWKHQYFEILKQWLQMLPLKRVWTRKLY